MQRNVEEAVSNNVLGTRALLEASIRYSAERFVLVSTDKAATPVSIMGATKRLAELMVRHEGQRSGKPFVAVRFGNVLGSRGSVVPHFKRQIEGGGPITITHPDMRRFFMTIPEAVLLVLRAAAMGRRGELFVLNMGEPIRIVDLARDLVRLSGLEPEQMPVVFTGIRPGERVEEALWENGARVESTPDPDILQVDEPDMPDHVSLDLGVAAIERALDCQDTIGLEVALAQLLPTYVPGDLSMGLSKQT
jgi:FlaA1/EpsC-like NDP-sugar epimerase